MQVQTIVDEFKGRVGRVGVQTQDALKSCQNANRQAFSVVAGNVQTLAKTQTGALVDFYGTATGRFNEARKEGVKKIVFVPVDIYPEGRDSLVSAYRDVQDHFVRTRDDLVKIVRESYAD